MPLSANMVGRFDFQANRPARWNQAAVRSADRGAGCSGQCIGVPGDFGRPADQPGQHGCRQGITRTALRGAAQALGIAWRGTCGKRNAAPELAPILARREGKGGKLVEQFATIERTDILIADRIDMGEQPRLEARLVLWRGERHGIALRQPQRVDQGCGCFSGSVASRPGRRAEPDRRDQALRQRHDPQAELAAASAAPCQSRASPRAGLPRRRRSTGSGFPPAATAARSAVR